MSEVWKQIEGSSGYQVSSHGRVYSTRILKGWVDDKGYKRVDLGRKRKSVGVHVLVLEAFVGPRPIDKKCGCHRDNLKLNNAADNLYWGTYRDNQWDTIRSNKVSKYVGVNFNNKLKKWTASAYLGTFDSEEDAAKAYDTAILAAKGEHECTNILGKNARRKDVS